MRSLVSAAFCGTLVLSYAGRAIAQESGTPEEVVVTATRTPQPIEVTGESVSVITANDLAVQQIDLVSDALAETPGIDVVRSGGVGQTTTISIRGAEAGQSLVLVDGIRINDPSTVDDQAEWLDNKHVLYDGGPDILVVRADGTGKPALFVPEASSPVVVRTP